MFLKIVQNMLTRWLNRKRNALPCLHFQPNKISLAFHSLNECKEFINTMDCCQPKTEKVVTVLVGFEYKDSDKTEWS